MQKQQRQTIEGIQPVNAYFKHLHFTRKFIQFQSLLSVLVKLANFSRVIPVYTGFRNCWSGIFVLQYGYPSSHSTRSFKALKKLHSTH